MRRGNFLFSKNFYVILYYTYLGIYFCVELAFEFNWVALFPLKKIRSVAHLQFISESI